MGFALVGTLACLLLPGCSSTRVHRLVPETYPAKSPDYQVKLYINKVTRPHREIAFIDSRASTDRSEATQSEQLRQLQQKARSLGADAVHDIRSMTHKVRGVVADERVPFQAYKQGRYELFFLRGIALVYLPEPEEDSPVSEPMPAPSPAISEPAESTPESITPPRDAPEPVPTPTVPATEGKRPVIPVQTTVDEEPE
jgi:hypothetical protein